MSRFTINKFELLGMCQRISTDVKNRIDDINKQKNIINLNYIGESNRAAILFYTYMHAELYEKIKRYNLYNPKWYSNKNIHLDEITQTLTQNPFDVFGISCEFIHGNVKFIHPNIMKNVKFIHPIMEIELPYSISSIDIEHNIVRVKNEDAFIYVDITSKQFQIANNGNKIPDSYVSFEMPSYFNPD